MLLGLTAAIVAGALKSNLGPPENWRTNRTLIRRKKILCKALYILGVLKPSSVLLYILASSQK